MKIIKLLLRIWYKLTYRFRREQLYIIKAQLSGDDSFIDIRYRLSRPDKVKGRAKVCLIDEMTGKRLYLMALPRLGAIQTKHKKYQATGVLLFRNSDYLVKSESKVTLIFGNFQVKQIRVA